MSNKSLYAISCLANLSFLWGHRDTQKIIDLSIRFCFSRSICKYNDMVIHKFKKTTGIWCSGNYSIDLIRFIFKTLVL